MSTQRSRQIPTLTSGLLSIILILWLGLGMAWGEKKKASGKDVTSAAVVPSIGGNLQPEYRVGPGDMIDVSVWKEPEVSSSVVIRPDGKISLPLISEVFVNEKTPAEIQSLLTEKLSPLINSPNVTVTVKEIKSKKVYVLGQVLHSGVFDIAQPKTVLQILTEAGGPRPFAKEKSMYVLRNEDGKQHKLPFNYKEVVQGKKIEQNVQLRPGDTVVVP